MPALFITEQGSIIRKTSDRLIVQKAGEVLMEIPCLKLDTVLLFGNVQVTAQAMAELLDHGIELAILTSRGKLRGQITPPWPKNLPLRMRQYDAYHDERFRLRFAREVVKAKIESSAAVLRSYRMNHPEAVPLEEIHALAGALPSAAAAGSLDSLRGVEGSAAARYFRNLAGMVPPGLGFRGRNRRPPRDPVNALLSFGYGLVGNELQSLLDGMGFEPYIGFYHQVAYGRPSLALDLLEELRAPLVDRFTTSLLNRRVFQKDDFTSTEEKGVGLRREAMKRYFAAYERELNTPQSIGEENLSWRQLFRRQAERLSRALLEDVPYEAFRLPC